MCVSLGLDAPGNTRIPGIPLASVSQVARPHGAIQPASQSVSQLGSSIMKDAHLDPVTHLMGLCVCEKEKVFTQVCLRFSEYLG